jgi:molecular chaperone GrpE (heat shock protein)
MDALLLEIRLLREALDFTASRTRTPGSPSETEITAVRRLLGDLIDARMEDLLADLVSVRVSLPAGADGLADAVRGIDALIEKMGATRFEAEAMDFPDPLIHAVTAERRIDGAPDGVIVETVRPGYRAGHGAILAKACVAVNRRP